MLEFIVGFVLGFWVSCNQEEVKGYWKKLKTWFKENCIDKDTQNNDEGYTENTVIDVPKKMISLMM